VLSVHSNWKRCSGSQISRIIQTSVSTNPNPISAVGHMSRILINLSVMILSKLTTETAYRTLKTANSCCIFLRSAARLSG
jgi:hypothetical protein